MQLEKYYTCYIERRLHIPYNPASARLTIGLLMFNALIQLKILQYWWWFWRQWYRDVASGILTEQKLISDCRYRVIESSSLVPVLFREVFSHPYMSLFHLLVNGFSVIIIIIIIHHFFRRVFSEYTEANATWLIQLDSILPEIVPFIIGFSFSVWTKVRRPCWLIKW